MRPSRFVSTKVKSAVGWQVHLRRWWKKKAARSERKTVRRLLKRDPDEGLA